MLVFYQAAFGTCLLLLGGSYVALAAAHKKGDKRQARVLHLFRLGFSLSALSYFLRMMGPPSPNHTSFPVFVTCLAGTIFIWLGWIEHWKLRLERLSEPAVPRADEECDESGQGSAEAAPAFLTEKIDTSRLNPRARQVILTAQEEARRRRQCFVDTDHLLLGLLRQPHCAGVQILTRLDSSPEKVHLDLLGQTVSQRRWPEQEPAPALKREDKPLALTDRAQRVIDLAALEAHRFDKAAIGTEHLLLGLVLMGTGPAAAVLFGEGVTVERIRDEIIRAGKLPGFEKP